MIERYMSPELVASRLQAFLDLLAIVKGGVALPFAAQVLGIKKDPLRRISSLARKTGQAVPVQTRDADVVRWHLPESAASEKAKRKAEAVLRDRKRHQEYDRKNVVIRRIKAKARRDREATEKQALERARRLKAGEPPVEPKPPKKPKRKAEAIDSWPIKRKIRPANEPLPFACRAVASVFDLGLSS